MLKGKVLKVIGVVISH